MQNEADLTLQPEDVHTMVYTRLDADAVCALSASCKRLYLSLKRQLVSVLATVIPRDVARIAAVALTLTESSEVRPFIMSCPTTAPPGITDEDGSLEWMLDAWRPTGFIGRLTRSWSLPEQAVTFIECRPLEQGSAGEDFVSALESEDHYSLEGYWEMPATTLVNRCGSPQEKATLLRHIFAGLELKTPANIGRAMHVMAAGPNHQLYGDYYNEACYFWEWDRSECPILEDGGLGHTRDACEYCSYSSAPLATVTRLFAADLSVGDQVALVQAIVGKWSKCEQLIFVSHFTVSMPLASKLALAAVVLPTLELGSPENQSSAFLGLFDFISEPMYSDDSYDMYASDEVRRICFDFLKHGLHEHELAAFLDCVKASKRFSNILVDDACGCDRDVYSDDGNDGYDCSCIDAKRQRVESLVRLLVSEDKCKAWCKTNLKVERQVVVTWKVTCTVGKESKTIVLE